MLNYLLGSSGLFNMSINDCNLLKDKPLVVGTGMNIDDGSNLVLFPAK